MSVPSNLPVHRPDSGRQELDICLNSGPPGPESWGNTVSYLRLVWDHRTLLYRVGIYALLASALIAFLIPSRYESTTRLMPPDNQPNTGMLMAAASMSGSSAGLGGIASDLLGLKSTSDVFVGILSSRTAQDKIIEQFDLKKVYSDRRMEDARKDLAQHTSISIDRRSQIIAIVVMDKSPVRAAAICQAYVEQLNQLVANLSTSSARRERIFLEGRLQGVSQDLEAAEKEFSQFASKNTTIDIKEQGKAMVEAAATLQGQLIASESEYEGLKQIYSDNNVRVRALKARIDELKHELERLGGKDESSTTVADQPGDSQYPSIRKLPLLGVGYADLYRRTRIQEAVLETLTKEYELAKVQEAKEIPTVRVLDVAYVPDKKSFPPRLMIIFFGTILALIGAILWIFGNTVWRRIDLNDPRKVFAIEVFSTVSARLPVTSRNNSVAPPSQGFWSRVRGRDKGPRDLE